MLLVSYRDWNPLLLRGEMGDRHGRSVVEGPPINQSGTSKNVSTIADG